MARFGQHARAQQRRLPGYSANDKLAPAVTLVALSIYADQIPPTNPRSFAQVRGAGTIATFAVNVITI